MLNNFQVGPQEAVLDMRATAGTSEGTQDGVPSHSMNNSASGRAPYSGHVLPHVHELPDIGQQKNKPKRRFFFRRHKEVSWECPTEGRGAAVDDSAGSICQNNNLSKARKRASPPTPWPGKGTAQGQNCETTGHESCTSSGSREKPLSTGV